MGNSICPSCTTKVLRPYGYSKDVLIIGDIPEPEDVKIGRPFVGPIGYILRKEFALLGIDLLQLRSTILWLHTPTTNKAIKDNCFKHGLDVSLEEAKNKKAVLLIGNAVEIFTEFNVSDVNGLQVDSHLLSAPIIYTMYNPKRAFVGVVGEIRFAIQNFVNHIQKENLI